MTRQVRCSLAALSLSTLLLPGCLNCLNPIPAPPLACKHNCDQIAAPCRDKVYVVLMNGADPLCCANLKGVRDYLNQLGFVKSYYGQLYHEWCLLDELRAIRNEQPDARIAIVGFEYGAGPAQSLARNAGDEGIAVDLVVLLQPKMLFSDAGVPQPSSQRLVAIRAGEHDSTTSFANANEVIDVPCTTRYGVPTHPVTLEALVQELTSLALTVPNPKPEADPFPSVLDDPALTPRPLDARKSIPDSQEIKPVSRPKPPISQSQSTPKLEVAADFVMSLADLQQTIPGSPVTFARSSEPQQDRFSAPQEIRPQPAPKLELPYN